MNVLSLFDGMSCGRIALERAGIPTTNYYASEIDKYAIKVSKANYPDIQQLGCVTEWREWDLPEIDLLIAGFPCQAWSMAGKQKGDIDPRGALVHYLIEIWEKYKPKYFMFENVKMKKEFLEYINDLFGVEPIEINSSLVSAQNRNRLYWTNIKGVNLPADKNIYWGDIREFNVADNFYYSEKGLEWIKRHGERNNKKLRVWGRDEKCQMIEASHFKNYSAQRYFAIEDSKGKRYITPVECERAQTIPDNYTRHVSNTQRYKMIGNGWTVDVIAHIFKGLK